MGHNIKERSWDEREEGRCAGSRSMGSGTVGVRAGGRMGAGLVRQGGWEGGGCRHPGVTGAIRLLSLAQHMAEE